MDFDSTFTIIVDYAKRSEQPSRVFKTVGGLIDSLYGVDRLLIDSVVAGAEVKILLDDISVSSLRTTIRTIISKIPDEALQKLDWKPIVGQYLVKGRRRLLEFLEKQEQVSDRDQLQNLSNDLRNLASRTGVNALDAYGTFPIRSILSNFVSICNAIANLQENDRVRVLTDDKEIELNQHMRVSESAVEQILTRETIETRSEIIMKVRKPDYLGASMWEFRYDEHYVDARISDLDWLNKFHCRQVVLAPGDSLRADAVIRVAYGFDSEVVSKHYELNRIKEVLLKEDDRQERLL